MTIAYASSDTASKRFRAAVSLHSHTHHSTETLGFLKHSIDRVAPARMLLRASRLDLHRLWWTPPLAPRDAWNLEKAHIEDKLGLAALISLTDHDDLEGPLSLRVLSEFRNAPVSVEWTVPFSGTFFHLGIHNLPPSQAREMMRVMADATANPAVENIATALQWINESVETLVVFNHPCWDEKGVGRAAHDAAVQNFTRVFHPLVHAVELNGFRPWPENQRVFELGRAIDRPVIAGGDRHALEPNTLLNLTNACTFAEFVEEIRSAESQVLVTAQYKKSLTMRVVRAVVETLHGRWADRASYTCDDGVTRSLTELGAGELHVQLAVRAIECLRLGAARMLPAVS